MRRVLAQKNSVLAYSHKRINNAEKVGMTLIKFLMYQLAP